MFDVLSKNDPHVIGNKDPQMNDFPPSFKKFSPYAGNSRLVPNIWAMLIYFILSITNHKKSLLIPGLGFFYSNGKCSVPQPKCDIAIRILD
jgi:hypothetical protein